MLANYLLVLLLWQSFDCKQVEEVSLLDVRLVAEASSQLELLSTETILRPGIDKTILLD